MKIEGEDCREVVRHEHLLRHVMLESYFAKYIEHLSGRRAADQRAKIQGRIKSLNARAKPGDEWWEWVSGSEPLTQFGGIALVREDKIFYAERHWIS